MTNSPGAAAVVFVDDVARLAAFYQALANMTMLQADRKHAVLEIPGLQLTIHALHRSGSGTASSVQVRETAHIKLCFPVDSIARARTTAAGFGGEVWSANKEWEAGDRGFRACDGRDPEGNVFQVRQPLSES
jgi:predicted enzyme related to lactoylglutathione lyase